MLTVHQHSGAAPGAWALAAAGLALSGAVAHALAASRLRRRGDRLPRVRDLCFGAGAALLVALCLTTPPGGPFTAHMAQHLAVGMAAPLLLVLGRPMTLALRSLPPGGRRRLLAVLRARPVRVVTHPVAAALLDAGGLWLLYRTPLFAVAHERAWVGVLVHGHVFAAGLLFSAVLCALDPLPRRHGLVLRSAALIGAGAAHGVLARTLYAAAPPGTAFAPDDLRAAAEFMYYGGDLVGIALAAVIGFQWYAASGRSLARERRRGARGAGQWHEERAAGERATGEPPPSPSYGQ
ncbi:cytochrome c oxidase assembly protein [Streptomyces sp. NPDC048111]|uniref:cytochrome c oxidase assembly protein n=1 Tax=Streptomyces sp. NPDC048111 TaxID=3365500 RepID=UPI00371438CA